MLVSDTEAQSCEFAHKDQLLLDSVLAITVRGEENQLLGELDALLNRRVLMKMYLTATAEKHSFWYIHLLNVTRQYVVQELRTQNAAHR